MYCRKCGAEIEEDSLFCKNCGEKIQKDSAINRNKIAYSGKYAEKIIGLVGGVMMLLSGYMDYFSVNFLTRYNFRLCERSDDWKIIVVLVIASLIFVFMDTGAVLGSFFTLGAAGMSILEMFVIEDAVQGNNISSSMITRENGFYFLMIGTVLLVIGFVAHVGKMVREGRSLFLIASVAEGIGKIIANIIGK